MLLLFFFSITLYFLRFSCFLREMKSLSLLSTLCVVCVVVEWSRKNALCSFKHQCAKLVLYDPYSIFRFPFFLKCFHVILVLHSTFYCFSFSLFSFSLLRRRILSKIRSYTRYQIKLIWTFNNFCSLYRFTLIVKIGRKRRYNIIFYIFDGNLHIIGCFWSWVCFAIVYVLGALSNNLMISLAKLLQSLNHYYICPFFSHQHHHHHSCYTYFWIKKKHNKICWTLKVLMLISS